MVLGLIVSNEFSLLHQDFPRQNKIEQDHIDTIFVVAADVTRAS